MSTDILSMVLNLVVVALLIATIVYASVLNRRLRKLREGEGELHAAIETFNQAASDAEARFADMKGAAKGNGVSRAGTTDPKFLKQQIASAERLSDDLRVLIGRGEVLADRLDSAGAARTTKSARSEGSPRSAAERELLSALKSAK